MLIHDPWIDGQTADAVGLERIIRTAPADGTVIASVAASTPATVDAAVAAARRSFASGGWADMAGSERAKVLSRFADLMERDLEALSRLEAVEAGKPIRSARGETSWGVELVRYAASLAWNLSGKIFADNGPNSMGMVIHRPRGVVGLILPWNFPIVCLLQKLPYALAAGCSVVIKPAELTSGTTLMLARLLKEAGLPDGVMNVVTGQGSVAGEALSTHMDVDMMSFTGSTAIGRRIAGHSAQNLRPVALELGGKGANIVFADADLDSAVEGAVAGFTINKGEECCAGSRILVEASIAAEFSERVAHRAAQIRVGAPLDDDTEMGPLISDTQLKRVMAYIDSGKNEGAKLLTGGIRLTGETYAKGQYVAPTVFADVTPGMRIVREEIFGPVTTIIPFETVGDAIRIANSTTYGLANGLWTRDLNKAMQVIRALESGTIYVNTFLETMPQLPFGGLKDSGLGKENGIEGLMEFIDTKAAFIRLKTSP
ncbi:aldehyde dehydrogenase family protein [Fuscibacter oryzae]|uniref:Aldehyde dehydrogenase family protein n=1 Tax=Fuscibacter oryzae TaxID=2803939 RepID=A0A8J7SWZ5_9RHOB|nr:aldehyde dehydrogenase family protein [Fuscibacter oryzae]MBL4929439.1 aldehyde dehydrogenase family protein [Fuscibacter oryzae]